MTPGYLQLQLAAQQHVTEPVCPKCKNPEFEAIGSIEAPKYRCPECTEQFFPEQTLEINFLLDALRIANEPGYDAARFEHVDVLVQHAVDLHTQIEELKELLATERKRLAGAQQIVNECSALTREVIELRKPPRNEQVNPLFQNLLNGISGGVK